MKTISLTIPMIRSEISMIDNFAIIQSIMTAQIWYYNHCKIKGLLLNPPDGMLWFELCFVPEIKCMLSTTKSICIKFHDYVTELNWWCYDLIDDIIKNIHSNSAWIWYKIVFYHSIIIQTGLYDYISY